MYLMQNAFGVKKVWPSKVESYLAVNAWTDQQQQDLISESAKATWNQPRGRDNSLPIIFSSIWLKMCYLWWRLHFKMEKLSLSLQYLLNFKE